MKYDAEEAAEVAILSRECMKHLGGTKQVKLCMRDCIHSGDWYYPEWFPWGWVILLVTLLTSCLSTGLVFSGGHVTATAINSRLGLGAENMTGVMVTAGSLSSTMMMAPLTTKLCTRNNDLTLDTSSKKDIPTFYRKWI